MPLRRFGVGLAIAALISSSCSGESQSVTFSSLEAVRTQTTFEPEEDTPKPLSTTTTASPATTERVRDLIADDLPTGPPARMTEGNVAFLQRLMLAAGAEISVDGEWGPESEDALALISSVLSEPYRNDLTENWWKNLLSSSSVSFQSDGAALDPTINLPDGAVLWRERSNQQDPYFSEERQFIVKSDLTAEDIAASILLLNPDVVSLGYDDWPSWVVTAGDASDLAVGSYDQVGIGDCFDFPTSQVPTARRVPCSSAHDGQVLYDSDVPQWMLDLGRYPSDDDVDDLYFEECVPRADEYRSDWYDEAVNLYIELLITVEEDWGYSQEFSCVWTTYDGGPLVEFVESDTGIELTVSSDDPILVDSFRLGDTAIGIIDKGQGRTDIAVAKLAK